MAPLRSLRPCPLRPSCTLSRRARTAQAEPRRYARPAHGAHSTHIAQPTQGAHIAQLAQLAQLALAGILSLGVAACGDDAGTSATAANTSETTSAGETTTGGTTTDGTTTDSTGTTTETTTDSGTTGDPEATPGPAVLIGGGASVCTSAAPSRCRDGASFPQETDLPLLTATGPTYRLDAARLAALGARPELSPAIVDGLGKIPSEVDFSYDELLDQLDAAIGLDLVPRGSAQRAVILGYTVNRHEEVVDLASTRGAAPALFAAIVDRAEAFASSTEAEEAAAGPRIGVITAASGDGRDAFLFYRQVFAQAGAGEVRWIPVDLAYRAVVGDACEELVAAIEGAYLEFDTPRRYPALSALQAADCADPAGLVTDIGGLHGFFLSGGDQLRHKGALVADGGDTPELAAIRGRVAAGAVIAGTSAGTAVLAGAPMITRGESYNALVWGPKAVACDPPQFELCVDDLVFDPEGGLDLFPFGLPDSHFSERGRLGRLLRLAADTGVDWIYGVDESTALIADPAGDGAFNLSILGDFGVQIADLRGAQAGGDPWTLSGAKVHYLMDGDRFDPATGAVHFAADKIDIAGDENYDEADTPSDDLFSSPNNWVGGARANPREFIRVSQDLCDSAVTTTYGVTYEGPDRDPEYPFRYRATLHKGADARCFDGPGVGDVAYAGITIDLAPEP